LREQISSFTEYIKFLIEQGKKLGIKEILIVNCHGGNTIPDLLNNLKTELYVNIQMKKEWAM